MRGDLMKGALIGAVSACLMFTVTTAMAGTGTGSIFNLGRSNSVNNTSTLKGRTGGRMLQLTNSGSGAALGLNVEAGKPAFTTNSSVRVANLNADLLDGMHSHDLVSRVATATQGILNTGTGAALSFQVSPGQPPLAVNSDVKVTDLNADTVDGIHGDDFVQGNGSMVHARLTEPTGSGSGTVLTVPGFGNIEASTGTSNYRLFFRNRASVAMDVWYSNGTTTTYASVVPNGGVYLAFDTPADGIYPVCASYGSNSATIVTAAHAGASGGVFSSQAIIGN